MKNKNFNLPTGKRSVIMNCQDFEKEYLREDGHLSDQVLDHARSCRPCRELLQIINLINGGVQAPSPELDSRTLASVSACMRSKPHSFRPMRIQTFLYAAAAALILLLAVVSLETKHPSARQNPALASDNGSNQHFSALSAENASDLDALWYLNREEANSELDNLELQLSLYANLL
jgi:hypothetical protein